MAASVTETWGLRRRDGLDVLVWPTFGRLAVDTLVTTRYGVVSRGAYLSLNIAADRGCGTRVWILRSRRRTRWCSLGSRLEDTVAGIGPAVAPGRYQMEPQVAKAARNCFRNVRPYGRFAAIARLRPRERR